MDFEVKKKSPMISKPVRFALGSRESLKHCDKILQKVEVYIDGESGTLYIVPEEEDENVFLPNFEIKIQN
jgi:hypothetical protein